MHTLDHTKIFSTFALRQLLFGSVNLRFYQNLHKRLGVVNPSSKGTAISDCRKSGKATPFLFLIFKFFTNATISRKFTTREQQYLVCSVQPTKRGVLSINIFRAMQVGTPFLQKRQVPLPMQNPTGAFPLCNSPHTPRAGKPNLAKNQAIPRVNIFFHSFFS